MKTEFTGFTKVFSFTWRQQTAGKGFRITFIVVALLCLLLPAGIMSALEMKNDDGGASEKAVENTRINTVAVVDEGAFELSDYEMLGQGSPSAFSGLTYVKSESLNAAVSAAGSKSGVILLVEREEGSYQLQVLIPYKSELEKSEVQEYEDFLNANYQTVLLSKAGLDKAQMAVVQNPVVTGIHTPQDDTNQFGQIKTVLSFVLPYLVIMGLYFMILFYGQGVANNVIQEKTSKLMENLLLSVKPGALVMGKVLAIFTTGVLQTLVWIVCLVGGFALGTVSVRAINPDTDMMLIQFFDSLDMFSGIFSITGIIVAAAVFLAGFLLYCSLSAIGGALASKQEDLGTTNLMFTMILIASFMVALFGGALRGNVAEWMYYVPFTAVLVVPGEALLGNLALWQGGLSLSILVITVMAAVWLAGKIYAMMVLYKGNPPSVRKLVRMLKGRRKNSGR